MSDFVTPVSFVFMSGDPVLLEATVTRDGETVSLLGMTVRFAMARRPGDDAVISTADGNATATITDAANGVFQVGISSANTADLSGTYQWEADIQDSSGNSETVARGYMTFRPSVLV